MYDYFSLLLMGFSLYAGYTEMDYIYFIVPTALVGEALDQREHLNRNLRF